MGTRISPREAHAALGSGATLVDVRTVAEFEAGHPEGAYNVPFVFITETGRVPNPDFIRVMESFGKAADLVLTCQSGARSKAAMDALEAAGFTQVRDQRAGWGGTKDPFGATLEKGWLAEGLPTGSGNGGEHSYARRA